MKVAFIVNQFPAVSETFVLRQITGLIDRGHEVDIYAGSPGQDTIRHRDVEKYGLLSRTYYLDACACSEPALVRLLKRIGLIFTNFHKDPSAVLRALNVAKFGKGALLLQVLCQIAPFLGKGPYDIVHCQFGDLGELGLLLKDTGILHGKIITSFRGYDISLFVKSHGDNIYDDLFKRGDLFLCVSRYIKKKLVSLGCDERKIVVHRSGVDTKKPPLLPKAAKRDKLRILTVARLAEKKGVEYGVRAVAKVLQRHPRVEYKIAGDGPLRERLQSLIEELKAGGNIELLGWKSQDEIVKLLQDSDILLAPSVTTNEGDEEGIPGVIMEACASGLPVVSTYHSGIPEVVRDGESGFLVAERDAEGLADKLNDLIERPDLRTLMGSRGREFVKEHYNIDRLSDRLVSLYRELLNGELSTGTAQHPAHSGGAESASLTQAQDERL
jgi:colanic acid/amylovoran biosynthesis glycosyltransferase